MIKPKQFQVQQREGIEKDYETATFEKTYPKVEKTPIVSVTEPQEFFEYYTFASPTRRNETDLDQIENLFTDDERQVLEGNISESQMKLVIDRIIAEVLPDSDVNWTLQIDTELCKVWSRDEGFEVAPDLPVLQSEHYFRDMDDPLELIVASEDDRFIWDPNYESYEFLPEFQQENTLCVRTVIALKIAFLESRRDFIEKRTKFTAPQANSDGLDHYLWVGSLPDELFPNKDEAVLRCHKIFGFYKVGRISDLPPDRRGDGKGIYLQSMTLING